MGLASQRKRLYAQSIEALKLGLRLGPENKYVKSEKDKHELDQEVLGAILQHEERVDGSGGPRGIFGDDLSFLTRLLSVSNYFDLLLRGDYSLRKRPYREYIGKFRTQKEHFDSKLIEAIDLSFKHLFQI